MDFDTREFRNALGRYPTGVAVVTAVESERLRGITVSSFTSLSLDPPLVLWSIAKSSRRYQTFTKAPEFTVSVLGEDGRAAAETIAAGDDVETVPLEDGDGPPAIAGALAVFHCRREWLYDGGDHVVIVGRVLGFRHRDGNPLVFCDGRYGTLANSE